ncbi:MAG: hypothetical protein JWM45_1675, partial [Pseudonocardiales bacterium]|nr:hypothetical protein [Pseudonocardiales bacterium]
MTETSVTKPAEGTGPSEATGPTTTAEAPWPVRT